MESNSQLRAIEEYYQGDPFSEFWDATAQLRESADEGRMGEFVKLSVRTSRFGDLGGFRLFSRLWPWRKEFAEIIVARDCGYDDHQLPRGYSIKVMRPGHEEVVIFSTGDSIVGSKNLGEVVREFSSIVTDLIYRAKSNTLNTADFSSWEGRHWRDILREEYFEPNLAKHQAVAGGYMAGLCVLTVLSIFVGPFGAAAVSLFGVLGAYYTVWAFFRVDPKEGKFGGSPSYGLRVIGGLSMIALGVLVAVAMYDPIISLAEIYAEIKDRLFD